MSTSGFHAVTDVCAQIGWPVPDIVASTGSTNADLVGRSGHGQLLVALEQTAGRGRLDRAWISRPGDGLTFSIRLDVPATVRAWGWIPLLAGVAVADAVRSSGAHGVGVKWPNDVVGGAGKLAGILSVREGDSAIVGIGLNLAFSGQRPDPGAVSVAELGGAPDADLLLAAVVQNMATWWERFVQSAGDPGRSGLQDAYLGQCVSVAGDVTVTTRDRAWSGYAEGIDAQGRLLVRDGAQLVPVAAGDVTLRA